jgi:hypothetical protein
MLKRGDKAIVHRRPLKVTIKTAKPRWWRGIYNCTECGGGIAEGTLYGVSSQGKPFCTKCCSPFKKEKV